MICKQIYGAKLYIGNTFHNEYNKMEGPGRNSVKVFLFSVSWNER